MAATPGMAGEFNVATAMSVAAGHHPFSLQGHDARSAAVSRAPGHTGAPGLMYETSYHSAPGQGLPYHVSMTAGAAASVTPDKSSLLQLSAAAPPPPHPLPHCQPSRAGKLAAWLPAPSGGDQFT